MLKSHPQKDGYPGIHRTILLPRPKSTFSEMWNLITLTVGGSDNTSQICIWSVSHDDGLGETALNSLECWGKNTHPTLFTKLKYLWYINPYGVFGSLWQVTNHLIKGFLQWNTAWQNQCKSGNEKLPKPKGHKRSGIWHQLYPLILITLQGINISHLGKRKIIFKMPFLGDMLVPWRVVILLFWRSWWSKCFKLGRKTTYPTSGWVIFKKHHVGSFFPPWIISPLHNFCVFIGKFKRKTRILNPVGTASGQGLIQRSFEPAISLAVVIPSVASQR